MKEETGKGFSGTKQSEVNCGGFDFYFQGGRRRASLNPLNKILFWVFSSALFVSICVCPEMTYGSMLYKLNLACFSADFLTNGG